MKLTKPALNYLGVDVKGDSRHPRSNSAAGCGRKLAEHKNAERIFETVFKSAKNSHENAFAFVYGGFAQFCCEARKKVSL